MQHNEFRDGYNRLVVAFPKMPEFTNEIGEVWFPAVEEFTKAEWERGIQDYIKNGRYVPKPSDIRKACIAARERDLRERGPREEHCPKCNDAGFFLVETNNGYGDAALLCDCGRCISKNTPQRIRDERARQLARALTDEAWELDKSGEVYRFRRKRRWVAEPPPVQDLGKAIESIFPEF